MIKRAFRSDVARVIFLPGKEADKGIFMEGQYNNREMFQIELKGTLAASMIQSNGCS